MEQKHIGMPKWASDSGSLSAGPQIPAMYANMERHPTEKMGTNAMVDKERRYLQEVSVKYGSHMAQRIVLDRTILASNQRLGGTGSSMFHLQMDMGRYDEMDMSDILSDPRYDPNMEKEGIHARCDKIYGL